MLLKCNLRVSDQRKLRSGQLQPDRHNNNHNTLKDKDQHLGLQCHQTQNVKSNTQSQSESHLDASCHHTPAVTHGLGLGGAIKFRSGEEGQRLVKKKADSSRSSTSTAPLRPTSHGGEESFTSAHSHHSDYDTDSIRPKQLVVTIEVEDLHSLTNERSESRDVSSKENVGATSMSIATPKQQIMQQLRVEFNENLHRCVLKCRNGRGSLVPVSLSTIRNCSARNPLLVEICELPSTSMSCNSSTTPMSPEMAEARAQTVRNVCGHWKERLHRIENSTKTLPKRRNSFVETEVRELTRRVDRLHNLVHAISQVEWQGVIRKHPLW